jgi:hypothetical protein
VREQALGEVSALLEDVIRHGLSDRELVASLDGLVARTVTSDGADILDFAGELWTLGIPRRDSWVLPVEAHLSLRPNDRSVLRVADRLNPSPCQGRR